MINSLFFLLRTAVILTIFFACVLPAAYAQNRSSRHILFLNSYHQTMGWSENILHAVYDELDPDRNNIVLHIDNMDTKRIFNQAYIRSFAAFLDVKYQSFDFDLIMASDNHAYDFLKAYRDQLFPNVPVVFCSVNNLSIAEVEKLNGFTGVEEIVDAPATLDTALKNHPETREVLVINDFLTSGKAVEEEIRKQLQSHAADLKIRYAGNLTVEELNAQVRSLGPGSIILLGAYFADRNREDVIGYEQMGPRLFTGGNVPVYTLYNFHVHSGVIGGKVAGGYQQGQQMAELAKKILSGTDADDLPVVRSGTTQWVFNYPELIKYSINVHDLPKNSTIINQPFSVYQTYKKEIWVAAAFIVILIVIICMLLVSIQHRRIIARRLQENELKLKTIFNQTYEFIGLLSPEGKLLDVNRPALDFCGVSKEAVINEPLPDTPWWNHSVEVQQELKHHLQQAAKGEIVNFESNHPGQGGLFIFDVTISPVFNDAGNVDFLVVEGRDVTDQKNAESARERLTGQLQQAQKLESLGTLAGGIAHDFNNLLSAILGFNELNLMKPECKGKFRKNSENIRSAALRGRDLVRQILTFSRKGIEKTELFKLHDVVIESLNLLRKTIPSSIIMHSDIDPESGWVMADETQLHQVIMNLSTNAFHAVEDEQGEIRISLKPETVTSSGPVNAVALQPGTYARLEISDSGKGMSKEVQDRIFDPFFTTKEQGKGTGLGLAVVHGIIQKLHGKIEVDSKEGKGTTFTLWIPTTNSSTVINRFSDYDVQAAGNNEHILWVDDEEMPAALGKELLEPLGYRVTTSTSAKEALSLFRQTPDQYDLIVTDQTMPEISGIQLAREALEVRPDIPVILCTGYSSSLDPETALSLGIKAFFMKPVRLGTLTAEIRKLLEN